MVAGQSQGILNEADWNLYHSGFRPGHGIETALVPRWIVLGDEQSSTINLLDLPVAFDTINQGILRDCLSELGMGRYYGW